MERAVAHSGEQTLHRCKQSNYRWLLLHAHFRRDIPVLAFFALVFGRSHGAGAYQEHYRQRCDACFANGCFFHAKFLKLIFKVVTFYGLVTHEPGQPHGSLPSAGSPSTERIFLTGEY